MTEEVVHMYLKRRSRDRHGRTYCGKEGILHNPNNKHEFKRPDPSEKQSFLGATAIIHVTCVDCLEQELEKTEEYMNNIASKIKSLG